MPGALQVFERASGKSGQAFFDAMRAGELKLQDMMPQVTAEFAEAARVGGALEEQTSSVLANIERIKQSGLNFMDRFYEGGLKEFVSGLLQIGSELLRSLQPVISVLGGMLRPLGWILQIVGKILSITGEIFSSDKANIFAGWIGSALTMLGIIRAIRNVSAVIAAIQLASGKYLSWMIPLLKTIVSLEKLQAFWKILSGVAIGNPLAIGAAAAAGIGIAGAGIYDYFSKDSGNVAQNTSVSTKVDVNPTFIVDGMQRETKEIAREVFIEQDNVNKRNLLDR